MVMAARAPAANHREITVTVEASAISRSTVSPNQIIAAQFIEIASFPETVLIFGVVFLFYQKPFPGSIGGILKNVNFLYKKTKTNRGKAWSYWIM
jgi:hypothetical protein